MKAPIELRESPHDEKSVAFSLIVSKARAPLLRRHLESLLALLALEDAPSYGDMSQVESPAQALKRLRMERGLTQKSIAQQLGVTQARVSDFEQGVKKIPYESARVLADFFGVGVGTFVR